MNSVDNSMERSGMKKVRIVFLVLAVFCFYWLVIGKVQICLLRLFTGLPCPGCGLTRAGIALLKGDWQTSIHYHPLLLPIVFVLITSAVPRWRIRNKYFYWGMLALLLGVYFVRLFMLFPDTAPMCFDRASLAGKLLQMFGK